MEPLRLTGTVAGMLLVVAAASPARTADCNSNGLLDECDISCGPPGGDCDTNGCGQSPDCNSNGIPDECDVAQQWAKLTAYDGTTSDAFGCAVSLSGAVAVVGAHSAGCAYVLRYDGVGWEQEAKLTADDGAPGDGFGQSLSVSGNLAVIGARWDDDNGTDSGSVYVFRYDPGVPGLWQQQAKLTASDGEAGDLFGWSLSVCGNVVVAGAQSDDDHGANSGSAYVFRYTGSGWQQEAKLTADDGAAGDRFGRSVSVDGDAVVVGASYSDGNGSDSGSAYVFRYDPAVPELWQQEAKLTADDGEWVDLFGESVSVSGDIAIAGAPWDDDNGDDAGAAYVFQYNGISWDQQAKIAAHDGEAYEGFGYSVSVSGNVAVVGANFGDGAEGGSGSAYVFRYDGFSWARQAKIAADDGEAYEQFGYSVSVSGNAALVGAVYDDEHGSHSGSAYVFLISDDCDANEVLDECDIAFGSSSDCNANRALDECDIGSGVSEDCNANTVPDECDIAGGTSEDCTVNLIPDECEPDCNSNGVADSCDIAGGTSDDCNLNMIPDDCDIASGIREDCNVNAVPDECDIAAGTSDDCNANTIPDECDIAAGTSDDCNTNSVPDECDAAAQEAKLIADDGAANEYFGESVSVSEDVAIAGVPWDDDNGDDSGSAYLFRYSGISWDQQAKIVADDGEAYELFGVSVSVSRTVAAVGAHRDDDNGEGSGSAYVFRYNGSVWQEEAKLTADDGAAGDNFGRSLSVSGNVAIVGAWRDDDNGDNSGSAYVFRHNGTVWRQEAKLLADDGAPYDDFGYSVSVSGNVAIAGALLGGDAGSSSGSAYMFRYNGSTWEQEEKLLAGDGEADDYFGRSVSVSGNVAVVGAHRDDDHGTDSGSAYVFRYTGSGWQQEAKLTADDGEAYDSFGRSVSVSGNVAVVGAWCDDDNGDSSGSAYVFRYTGSGWQQEAKLTADDAARDDWFGYSVSVSGNVTVAGANGDDDNGNYSGSMYVFLLGDDCNSNGVLDECDIAAGVSPDCNLNRAIDECEIASGVSGDCNANVIPDECDLIGAGDFDADGDVDLVDYSAFADCLAGPDTTPIPSALECIAACLDAFDQDSDGDVDVDDFADFQVLFTG